MKVRPLSGNRSQRARRRAAGFTLVDVLVSAGIFGLVTTAMIYAHVFGLRYNQLVESKVGASDDARHGLGELARDVRTAKFHSIGNMSGGGSFEPLGDGEVQRGNALQLILTTNQNLTVTYYFDTNTPSNFTLKRIRTGGAAEVIASHLTNNFQNSLLFMAEDHRGEVISDLSNRRVVRFILDFAQYQYPLTRVGAGHFYDRYKMEFRLTPHVPEGR